MSNCKERESYNEASNRIKGKSCDDSIKDYITLGTVDVKREDIKHTQLEIREKLKHVLTEHLRMSIIGDEVHVSIDMNPVTSIWNEVKTLTFSTTALKFRICAAITKYEILGYIIREFKNDINGKTYINIYYDNLEKAIDAILMNEMKYKSDVNLDYIMLLIESIEHIMLCDVVTSTNGDCTKIWINGSCYQYFDIEQKTAITVVFHKTYYKCSDKLYRTNLCTGDFKLYGVIDEIHKE